MQECLAAEVNMEKLIAKIKEGKTREEAMERIMTFVPCIMHCENCVGIKILTMLFIKGLSNYQGSNFPELANLRSEAKREDTYIE